MILMINDGSMISGPCDACNTTSKIVDAHRRYIVVYEQHDTAVAFMAIASVNIYAETIIVYVITGMENTDKRGLYLMHDDSRALELSHVLKRKRAGS